LYRTADAPASTTAAGKVLLAFDRNTAPGHLGPAPAVSGSGSPFDLTLRRIRQEGVAFTYEEHVRGFIEAAAPVRNRRGRVVAALNTVDRIGCIQPLAAARDGRRTAEQVSAGSAA
jgi:DNA-binding IclR family transcriptional regulator